jgi:hypothetical protein
MYYHVPWPNSYCVWTPVTNRDMHYSELMSVLRFRIWSLIKWNYQMAGRMNMELLQTVAVSLIPTSTSRWSFKETGPDTMHTGGVQDHHSSVGMLIYYLQFSVLHKNALVPVCFISGMMWEVFMEFGTLDKINTQNTIAICVSQCKT